MFGILLIEVTEDVQGLVVAAVIDKHDLIVAIAGRKHLCRLGHSVIQRTKGSFLIQQGDDV
jgi:hypothetical protein